MLRRYWHLISISLVVCTIPGLDRAGGQLTAESASSNPTKRVYVPVQDLEVLFERDQQGVILPRVQYEKLADAARRNSGDTANLRRDVVISQATYTARFPDDQLVLSAEIEFTQLKPGVFSIPLDFEGLAVESATVDGKPAQLGRAPAAIPQPTQQSQAAVANPKPPARPQLVLFATQPGRHQLKLELSAGLVSVGSDRVAAFAVPAVPAALLQVALEAGKFLHVNDVAIERPSPANEAANYSVALGAERRVALRITDQQARQDAATLTFAATAIGVHVSPEERTWRAVTTLKVYGKPIDSLEFRIPKALDIVSVESSGLERWEIVPGQGESETTLKLFYRQPFNETRTVTLQGISSSGMGRPWSIPTLKLAGATTHTVRVLVQHLPTLRLQLVEATHARRVSAGEVTASDVPDMTKAVSESNRLHFTAWREDFSLLFVTQPRDRELQAAITTRIDIGAHDLKLDAGVGLSTRFAPLFEVDLTLPAEWTIDEIRQGNQSASWRLVPMEAGTHQIRVKFDPLVPIGGKATLRLLARMIPGENWPIESGQEVQIMLPEVFLPEAGVTEGRYLLAADEALEIATEELFGLEPMRATPADLAANPPPRLIYEYQDTRFTGNLKISRKPARLAAETFAFHRLDRETLNSHLEALVHVAGGGARDLRLSLPEAAGTGFRFQLLHGAVRITEQTAAEPANGRRLWTLQFDQRAFGMLALAADLEAPRATDAANFAMPALVVEGAERQSGFVAVEAAPDQQVQITAVDGTGLRLADVDPVDLPLPAAYVPRERIVGAFRVVQPGYQVTLADTRFDREPVPTAICDKAALATILGDTGELQHEASYMLRAVGVQGLQVQLPHEATLWATVLDDRPIEVRRAPESTDGSSVYLVPLAGSGQPDAPRKLQLFYRTTRDALHGSGALRQSPPRLNVVTGQGTAQPIEILQQEWKVHVPRHIAVTSSTGEFEPTEKLYRFSILGVLQHGMSLDSPDRLLWKLVSVAIALAVLFVLTYAFRHRGVTGLILALAGGALLLVVATVSTFVSQEKSSARFSMSKEVATPPPATALVAVDDRAGAAGEGTVALQTPIFTDEEGKPAPSTPKAGGFDKDSAMLGMRPEDGKPAMPTPPPMAAPAESLPPMRAEELAKKSISAGAISAKEAQQQLNRSRAASGPVPAAADPFKAADAPVGGGIAGDIAVAQAPAGATPATPAAPPVAKPTAKGLLSLSVNLQPPAGSRTATFQYFGTPAGTGPELVLGYQIREVFSFVGLAWQAGLLLVFWLARHASPGLRGALAVFGLTIPLALVPIVPLELLPHLDGIFLGTIWGLCLWAAIVICHRIRAQLYHILPGLKPNGAHAAMVLAAGIVTALIEPAPIDAQERTAAAPQKKIAPPPHSIIIPYDLSEDPRKSERVYLPFDEFLKLWNAANPEKRIDEPPVEAVVAEALYAAELTGDEASKSARLEVSARYVVHSFVKRQVTVTLPLGPVGLSSGQLDGKSAPIVARDTDGVRELAVVLDQPGAHVLDVKFAVPVESTGPAGKATLPLKPVSSGTLRFVLPGDDRILRVNGAGIYRKVTENDRAVAVIPVDRAFDVTLSWSPSQKRDAAEQGGVQAETDTAVLIEDTGLALFPSVQLQVRQGTLSEVSFSLPEGLLVRHIAGPDLGGWEITGTGAERAVKVFLRRAVNDNTRLSFDLFQPFGFTEDGSTSSVPAFAPIGAARETGTLGIYVEGQLSASVVTATGLTQIDLSQYAAPAVTSAGSTESGARGLIGTSLPQIAYRYTRRPFELSLLVSRRKPQARVVAEHAILIGTHKAVAGTRFELTLTGAPRSQLTVQLPFGFLLYDLKSRDVADYFVESPNPEQGSFLHLDLAEPRTGQLEFIVEGVIPRDPEDLAPQIGFPTLVGISEQRAAAAIWIDAGYSAVVEESPGWRGIDPAQLPAWLLSARSTPVQFAFTSTLTALQPVSLTLTRAAARLSGDALTVVLARDTTIEYALHLRWKIAQARENRFSFIGPDWLEGRLDFTAVPQGPRVRQVLSEKLSGGRTRWTVILDDVQSDRYFALARAMLPPPKANTVDAPQIIFEQPGGTAEQPEWKPLETQSAHLLLINQGSATLEAIDASAVAAEPADELPIRVSRTLSDQAAEIVKVTDARAAIGWSVQSRGQAKSSSANVNLVKISLVLARDGSWRELIEYRIQNRGRQFLALQMPEKTRVLSLFVAGRPARPTTTTRNNRNLHLVPLPKTSAADLSAEVKLVCAGRLQNPLPRGVQVFRSDLDLPAPQVLATADDAEYGMPVAATEWIVYVPDDIDAKRIDDPDRTNVAASVEGYEDLMASFRDATEVANYLISLKGDRNDFGNNPSRRTYARNNLKQIGLALHNSQSAFYEKGLSSTQQQEIADNFAKLAELENQIQRQDAALPAVDGVTAVESSPLNAAIIQQDIVAGNRGDFEVTEADKSKDQFRLELQSSAAPISSRERAPAGAPGKTFENPQQLKRQELREFNAAQSAQINADAAQQQGAQPQPKADDRSEATRRGSEARFEFAPPDVSGRSDPGATTVLGDIAQHMRAFGVNAATGGGGGFGGGTFAGVAVGGQTTAAVDQGVALWTSDSGLSLDINIPQNGQKLTFSKSGGDARLAIGLRPRASLEAGFNLLWTILWIAAAIGIAAAFARQHAAVYMRRQFPIFLIAIGLVWYFLMPAQFIGFALFIGGALIFCWQHRRNAAATG